MSQFYSENSIHSKDKINNLILCTIKFKKSVKLFFFKNKIQRWGSESLTYFASNCIYDPQDGSFEDLDLLLSSERCLDRFQLRQAGSYVKRTHRIYSESLINCESSRVG